MEPVRSIRNVRVAEAVRLRRVRERRKSGLMVLEGPHLLDEARAAGIEIVTVFGLEDPSPEDDGLPWVTVTREVLDRLADTEHPRGPVAVARIPVEAVVTRDHLILDVADPGNAGTLIRTAAAFGLDVSIRSGGVDPWSPKVLRAAAGAHFRTALGRAPVGAGRIATVVKGGVDPRRFPEVLDPGRVWSILVGSEAHGLDAAEVAAADIAVTIPMQAEVDSLNAAVAGSVVAYELARWRADGTRTGSR
jgi:RNA methyltransferase, TrmH family